MVWKSLWAESKITVNKMAEEQQEMKEPQQVQQVTTKEPQQVTTKNRKKVEAGKRLAEHNRRKREVKKREEQAQVQSGVSQYYGIGAVLAVGVIGGLGYYISQTKKGGPQGPTSREASVSVSQQPCHQTNKFEMD